MSIIKTELLKEGMKFPGPLFFDDGKNMFLAEHKPIRKFHLEAIYRWKISNLVIHDTDLLVEQDGVINDFSNLIDTSAESSLVFKEYIEAVIDMESIFISYKEERGIDKLLIEKTVRTVYKLVSQNRYIVAELVLMEMKDYLPFAVSAVNSAILSVIMGMDSSFPHRNLLQLLTAALLHDLDMMSVPEKIVNKKGRLTAEEFEILKVHPLKTAQTLMTVFKYSKEIATILMQHHERWDGTGYPESRKGQNIAPSARILSVADAFEAMISKKTYRNSMIAYDAVKNLLADKEKRFDPLVLKVFIKSIGVYPAGSYVLLNNSAIAKVTEGDPDAPFMPTVKIIHSKNSQLEDNTVINLKSQKIIFIIRALDPKELDSIT